nr:synaptobrevin, longin-like domain protein [Tanacetum cinerariifolium]
MISILEKYELNTDFHQIVDFVEASHLRIETTDEGTKILATIDGKLRTISESSIRRNLKLKDEAGISSLPDAELFENRTLMGYNILPNQKFSFQKGQFSHQWKFLIHTIMQCLSPKSTGFNEFSSNIATALVCLATNRVYNFLKMIFDGIVRNELQLSPYHTPSPEAQQTSPTTHLSPSLPPITTEPLPTAIPSDTPQLRQYTRRARIAHSSALPHVADEPTANITKTSTLPSDSTPRVTSLAADEGSMQQQLNELTDLCTRLQRQQDEMASKITAQDLEISQLKARVKLLEDREGGDAPIKGRSLDEGEEAAIKRSTKKGSNDTEEMVNVLTSLDAATVLSSGVSVSISIDTEVSIAEVPTGSGSIPTASPPGTRVPTCGVPTGSDVVPTASPIFTTTIVATPYTRMKGKEKMVESETPKKKKIQEQMDVQMARQLEEEMERDAQRMNEQIARDAEIARIHAEKELQIMIDGLDRNNETVAKYLQEYYQFAVDLPIGERIELISNLVKYQYNYAKVLKYQIQQRKPLSRKQQKEFYMSVLKSHACWKARHFKGMT